MNKESDATNNHGTWFDVQVVTYRLFLNDQAAAKVLESENSASLRRLSPMVMSQRNWCTQIAQLQRVQSISRGQQPCQSGKRAGVDLWHYKSADGRSIRVVIDALLPYAMGEKEWPHQQIVKFDPKIMIPILQRAAISMKTRLIGKRQRKSPAVNRTWTNRIRGRGFRLYFAALNV